MGSPPSLTPYRRIVASSGLRPASRWGSRCDSQISTECKMQPGRAACAAATRWLTLSNDALRAKTFNHRSRPHADATRTRRGQCLIPSRHHMLGTIQLNYRGGMALGGFSSEAHFSPRSRPDRIESGISVFRGVDVLIALYQAQLP